MIDKFYKTQESDLDLDIEASLSELTYLRNFKRKNINDEDLFNEVPLDQHIKKHDQIFVTFNRVSDLKVVKETEIQSEFATE